MKKDKLYALLPLIILLLTSNPITYHTEVNNDINYVHIGILQNIQYNNSENINIDGNTSFSSYVESHSLTGNGSVTNPIIIENLLFNGSDYSISIQNTDLHFKIMNCFFSEGIDGIYFYNVESGNITNNSFINQTRNSLRLIYSFNITISNNDIVGSTESGIYLSTGSQINITENVIDNCKIGIQFTLNCNLNKIFFNNISQCSDEGIILGDSTYNNIQSNRIHNNTVGVKYFRNSNYNTFIQNIIFFNRNKGIYIEDGQYNKFSNNTIVKNVLYGISLYYSDNNTVVFNDFISNGEGLYIKQGRDDSGNMNNFSYNHWNDWNVNDSDNNLIYDTPYNLSGTAITADYFAKVYPYDPLTTPNITNPIEFSIINENSTLIQWNQSSDIWGNVITYNVYSSSNDGSTWNRESNNLVDMEYIWNLTNIIDHARWKIKVIAQSEIGIFSDSIVNFSIINYPLTEPILIYPVSQSNISGIVNIQWEAIADHWGRPITYSIEYSPNGGSMWINLKENHFTNNYYWNTYGYPNGSTYEIKIIAKCISGITSEDSIGIINMTNPSHKIYPGELVFPNQNTTVNRTVEIIWNASIDTWEYNVFYDLYYSVDGGEQWNLMIVNLTENRYFWNTTDLPDGDNYTIKLFSKNSAGLNTTIFSNGFIEILNHQPSIPIITSLQPDETYSGIIDINWQESIVPYGTNVTYSVCIDYNNGQLVFNLTTDYDLEFFNWKSCGLLNGSYVVKVIATSAENISSEYEVTINIINYPRELTGFTIDTIGINNIVWGSVSIDWTESIDTWSNSVTYTVLISNNRGETWSTLATDISDSNLIFDSNLNPDKNGYMIKVVSHSYEELTTENLYQESISNEFSINNTITLSNPKILNPQQDEIVSGNYKIKWDPAISTRNYEVSYILYHVMHYKDDSGLIQISNTTLLATTTDTEYIWNTTSFNSWYLNSIYLIAWAGLNDSSTVLNHLFVIQNTEHTLSNPWITVPDPEAKYYSTPLYSFEWSKSVDSLGYDVSYSIYYSNSNESEWYLFQQDIQDNYFSTNISYIFHELESNEKVDSVEGLYIKIEAVSESGLVSYRTIYIPRDTIEEIKSALETSGWIYSFTLLSILIFVILRKKIVNRTIEG